MDEATTHPDDMDWISPSEDGPSGESGPTVSYHFPVEVRVIGGLDEETLQAVSNHVFAQLNRELDTRL